MAEYRSKVLRKQSKCGENVSSKTSEGLANVSNMDVFISYSSADREMAIWVKSQLEAHGMTCWMDQTSIPGGADYADEIPAAIAGCKYFVLLLSKEAQGSQWVDKELREAIDCRKIVFPFMIENCILSRKFEFCLRNVQRYAAYEDKSAALQKMIGDIQALNDVKHDHNTPTYGNYGQSSMRAVQNENDSTYAYDPNSQSQKTCKSAGSRIGQVILWILFFPIMLVIKVCRSQMGASLKVFSSLIILGLTGLLMALCFDGLGGTTKSPFPSGSHSKNTVIEGDLQYVKSQDHYVASVNPESKGSISGSVTISSSVEGLPVTQIAEHAFQGCANITSVVIPDSVTSIGCAAFEGCSDLESLTLPFVGNTEGAENEKAVLGYIFGYETGSKDEGHGYLGSENDHSVNLAPTSIPNTTWQFTWVQSDTTTYYHYYIPETLKEVTVTKQTAIPDYAFNGCKTIEKISYTSEEGSNLSVGEAAFQNCSALKFDGESNGLLSVDNRFSQIGDYAFRNCGNILSLEISDSVGTIGYAAFEGCGNLASLTLPFIGNTESAENEKAVLGYIFGYETGSKDEGHGYWGSENDHPANLAPTSIPGTTWQFTWVQSDTTTYYHYYIPEALKEVTVTKQTAIPDYAFNGCKTIEKISYTSEEGSNLSVGEAAFQNCLALKFGGEEGGKLCIDNRFSQIGDYAYRNCENIRSVEIAQSVLTIGYAALEGCDHLASLTTPFVGNTESAEKEKAVLGYIFGYETGSKGEGHGYWSSDNDHPANLAPTSIPGTTWQFTWVQYDETTYYHYYIPETLKAVTVTKQASLPGYAFNGCKNLETVTLPKGYQAGEYAFQNCNAQITERS